MESMNVKYPVEYLIEHLNSFESPEVAVKSLRKEGIMCKNRDDLYMFKYHLGCKFDKIYHLACRGVILRKTDSGWKVLSYPFDKFFNWGEELQPEIVNYYQTLRYASPLNEKRKAGFMFKLPMKLIEKLDGTCVILYYDEGWKVHTLGSVDANGTIVKNGMVTTHMDKTYRELFWRTFEKKYPPYLLYHLNPSYCYIFEMVHPDARVVVPYEEPNIILIGVRSVDPEKGYFEVDPSEEAVRIFNESGGKINLKLPAVLSQEQNYTLFHANRLQELFEEVTPLFKNLRDGYDVVYEGFVAVQEIAQRVYYRTKIKHPVYLEYHRIKTTITPEKLADLFLENKLDDFVLTPDEQETVMKIKEIYTDMRNQLESSFDTIYKEISKQVSPEENPEEFRKRFALRLMDYHDKSWFFARLDGNEEKMQKSEKKLLTERIEKGLFK